MTWLMLTIFLALHVQQSVSQAVKCYAEFDTTKGTCCHVLGDVAQRDCCMNSAYGFKDADGVCKSCRKAAWSEWSEWSSCSVSCKEGVQQRRRACYGIGICRDPETLGELQTRSCQDSECCPKQGGYTEWGQWQPCSVTCEAGRKKKFRSCTNPAPVCGGSCEGESEQVTDCVMGVCPTHGAWSKWDNWGPCSGTCVREGFGSPQRVRYRTCTNPKPSVEPRGNDCEGTNIDSEDCPNLPFCPVNGNWGPWGAASACSVTCGLGRQTQTRKCDSPAPKHGGKICEGMDQSVTVCKTAQYCPVDGAWSSWGSWGECEAVTTRSISCRKTVEGIQERDRYCENKEFNGNSCQGDIVSYRDCFDVQGCKMDHYWTEWSEWGLCKPPCGEGSQKTRERVCKPDTAGYKPKSGKINLYGKPLLNCENLETTQSVPCHNVPSC